MAVDFVTMRCPSGFKVSSKRPLNFPNGSLKAPSRSEAMAITPEASLWRLQSVTAMLNQRMKSIESVCTKLNQHQLCHAFLNVMSY